MSPVLVSQKVRNVVFTLAGVAGLLIKGRYTGPFQTVVHSYGGNISVSFAVYFLAANLPFPLKFGKLAAAGLALAAVDLFEATDGFKVMANTYDPVDFLANAVGVAIAWSVDTLLSKAPHTRNSDSPGVTARPPK